MNKLKHTLPILILLTSCTKNEPDVEEEKPAPKITPQRQVVGRIASVAKNDRFVLIQKYGPGLLPPNFLYQSQGADGRTASLRPSGERVRDFYAADLISGSPQKGDAVIAIANPKKEEKEEKETDSENLDSTAETKQNPDSKDQKPPARSLDSEL